MSRLEDMLRRAQAGEVIETILAELDSEDDMERVVLDATRHRSRAQRRLESVVDEANRDGNDDGHYDRDIDQAAEDVVRAEDHLLKARDPDLYNERRQMGLLI